MARHPRNTATVATAWLALVAAACGPTGTPTAVPSADAPTQSPQPPATPSPTATPEPLPALELLWETGGATEITGWYPGTFSPAVDPVTGDIWVALSSEHLIWIFSKDGEYKGSFGGPGDGRGEFDFRRPACLDCPGAGALAFAPDGSLFVADVGNHRVQKFDPSHEFETEWGGFGAGEGHFADAIQIATNGDEVFVGDDVRTDTQVFDTEGKFLRTLPAGWLAVDGAGGVSISSLGTVHRYDPDGDRLDSVLLPKHGDDEHIGLAIDEAGRLFFNFQDPRTTDAFGLGELVPSTGASRTWSTAGETLAIAGDVIYVANYTGTGWPEPVLRAFALPAP